MTGTIYPIFSHAFWRLPDGAESEIVSDAYLVVSQDDPASSEGGSKKPEARSRDRHHMHYFGTAHNGQLILQ